MSRYISDSSADTYAERARGNEDHSPRRSEQAHGDIGWEYEKFDTLMLVQSEPLKVTQIDDAGPMLSTVRKKFVSRRHVQILVVPAASRA
jgi:hypothetical protein